MVLNRLEKLGGGATNPNLTEGPKCVAQALLGVGCLQLTRATPMLAGILHLVISRTHTFTFSVLKSDFFKSQITKAGVKTQVSGCRSNINHWCRLIKKFCLALN